MSSDKIQMTVQEAIEAICRDFNQYDPQILLFSEISRLLFGQEGALVREPDKEGAWVKKENNPNRQWMDGKTLINHMCAALRQARPDPHQLVEIAARVFQARARLRKRPLAAEPDIEIDTGMVAYRCGRCGQCCEKLDYRKELTAADIARWKKDGRQDILDWVGVTRHANGQVTYQMWVAPGTNHFAPSCPFLEKEPASGRFICSIHDNKPGICEQYPVSRKHALMTGCQGFSRTE